MARSTDAYLERVDRLLAMLETEVDRVRQGTDDLRTLVQAVEEGTGDEEEG